MKKDIHPKYVDAQVSCACGNSFVTRATVETLKVDICNECHPFYTGKQKFVDTAGRVDAFQKKFGGNYFGKGAAAEQEARARRLATTSDIPSTAPVRPRARSFFVPR